MMKTPTSPLELTFSGSALKLIAVLSMVADHCAYAFLQHGTILYDAMRCFGRIAFPVFAFLIAEGFIHTRNRLKYCLSLLVFAVISEWPWQLLMGVGSGHNVMFTLTLGVIALEALRELSRHKLLAISIVALIAYIATRYHTDYEWRGICMIVIFYIFRERSDAAVRNWALHQQSSSAHLFVPFLLELLPILQVLFAFPLMMHYGVMGAVFASIVILLYNGQRGFIKGNIAKYAFYVFYPAHLLVIWLLTAI